MLPIILFVIIVSWGLYAFKFIFPKERRRLLELAAKVPTRKGALPVFGHAIELARGVDKIWQKALEISSETEQAGGILTLWIGPYPQFIINDPDDALTLLNSCLKKNYLYDIGITWFGDGLFSADAPIWKRSRKLLNPTFSQHVLDGFLDTFSQQSALLVRNLKPFAGTGEFDPREYFIECTLESVCQTAVGISLDDKSFINHKFKKAIATGVDIMTIKVTSLWFHSKFIFGLSSIKKIEDEALAIVQDTARSIINKKKAERQEVKLANTTPPRYKAFLDLLLDMAEDGLFTDKRMQEEVMTMIIGGFDTSARALHTILVLVGSHPRVQEKMFEEIMSVVGTSTHVAADDMRKLVYTEAVIKEALRVCSIAPLVGRNIDKEIKLKNYTLPAGSAFLVSLWGINRLPAWGPDRLEFRPERWLDPASLPQSPGAFSVFSLGRRGCIGRGYALMALKINLVHLIREFRVTADYSKAKFEFNIFLKFLEGYQVSLELRKSAVDSKRN